MILRIIKCLKDLKKKKKAEEFNHFVLNVCLGRYAVKKVWDQDREQFKETLNNYIYALQFKFQVCNFTSRIFLLNLLLLLFQPLPPAELKLLLLFASDRFGSSRRALLPLLLSVLGASAVLRINCAERAPDVETQPTHGSSLSIYYKPLRSFLWAYLEIILEKFWMARF